MNSPFKFLDSYTKDDRDIFFGRDREIEELYQKVFESKILLLYGVSGTGKSSLIDCGLGNKIADSDWLPVNVRRGSGMVESLWRQLSSAAFGGQETNDGEALKQVQGDGSKITGKQIVKKIKSVYLDHFKPIYLIFDQFEELFIFGSKEERQEFTIIVKAIMDAEVQCKMLFSIREEYLAGITEFERVIPEIMQNRMRVEKMSRANAIEVIEGPCKINEIIVEGGFADTLMSKLVPEGKEVELTYLQVYLDKVYRMSASSNSFTLEQLKAIGDVGDILADFLEEQLNELEDADTGMLILKAFVSMQGTRKQISEEDILDFVAILGKPLDTKQMREVLLRFVGLRVLRDRDENGLYELRHDSLAAMIYEKITLVEKELLEIKYFLDNAYLNFQKRKVYLTSQDLKYIAPYESLIFLNKQIEEFIEQSKRVVSRLRRRLRLLLTSAALAVILVLTGLSIWAMQQRRIALVQEDMALTANQEAKRARNETEALEELIEAGEKFIPWAMVAADKMNILYRGVDNPVSVFVSSIDSKDTWISTTHGTIRKVAEGRYIVNPGPSETKCDISVYYKKDDITWLFGVMNFRVLNLHDPFADIGGRSSGRMSRDELLSAEGISARNSGFAFEVQYEVVSFNLSITISGGVTLTEKSESNLFTQAQQQLIQNARTGSFLLFSQVRALGPDGVVRDINDLIFILTD